MRYVVKEFKKDRLVRVAQVPKKEYVRLINTYGLITGLWLKTLGVAGLIFILSGCTAIFRFNKGVILTESLAGYLVSIMVMFVCMGVLSVFYRYKTVYTLKHWVHIDFIFTTLALVLYTILVFYGLWHCWTMVYPICFWLLSYVSLLKEG